MLSFAAFHFGQVSFVVVLVACGAAHWLLRRKPGGGTAGAALLLAPALAPAERLAEISWFFLKVGLFSFGGAYAALPYMRQGRCWTTAGSPTPR